MTEDEIIQAVRERHRAGERPPTALPEAVAEPPTTRPPSYRC
ncbi:hypothetical protein [Streptomyces sp. NPDC050548]